ncbi:hypothetical protein D4740_06375 [Actinomyces sp. 2119]|uniref:hypothetical protein n=1 Tax=Actinomyces sp. 2119 TaxID=2321393 RepID=UPI000E6CB441|nr:hypothetical protein [Actinomyces sp. 2119]RJF42555.1 hypothetical protein D4740_06375 [Actinomyces sp. 2119]
MTATPVTAAALLWAYDAATRFGLRWRPRTLLAVVTGLTVLAVVPVLALALLVGRLCAAVDLTPPWPALAAAWAVWQLAHTALSQKREELTAPVLAPFMRAVDLGMPQWFLVRFTVPAVVKGAFTVLAASGLLVGSGADSTWAAPSLLVIAAGTAAELGLMAQLMTHQRGPRQLLTAVLLCLVGALALAPSMLPSQLGLAGACTALTGLAAAELRTVAGTTWVPVRARRRRRRTPLSARTPVAVRTLVVLRLGCWVPPVRALLVRSLTLALLLCVVLVAARASVPDIGTVVARNGEAAARVVALGAVLPALTITEAGVSWYGVRSRCYQLRAAWEAGACGYGLAVGSTLAHLLDGLLISSAVGLTCFALAVPPTAAVLLLPVGASLAGPLGSALVPAPQLPDGRCRSSLAGALAGMGLLGPHLYSVLTPSAAALPVTATIVLLGGLPWVSLMVIRNASFSIV